MSCDFVCSKQKVYYYFFFTFLFESLDKFTDLNSFQIPVVLSSLQTLALTLAVEFSLNELN